MDSRLRWNDKLEIQVSDGDLKNKAIPDNRTIIGFIL